MSLITLLSESTQLSPVWSVLFLVLLLAIPVAAICLAAKGFRGVLRRRQVRLDLAVLKANPKPPIRRNDVADRVFADRYRAQELLGAGSDGEVWKGVDEKTEGAVAIKVAVNDAGEAELRNEVGVLRTLDHPGIPRALASSPKNASELFMVMTLMGGTNLRNRTTILRQEVAYQHFYRLWFRGRKSFRRKYALTAAAAMPHAEWKRVFGAVASIIDHAHNSGVAVGDLKMEHIIVSDDSCSMVDFGGSALIKEGQTKGRVSPMTAAPESAQGHSIRGDIYSLAVLMVEGLTGCYPRTHLEVSTHAMWLSAHVNDHLRNWYGPYRAFVLENEEELRTACPGETYEPIRRALSTDPDVRPATATDLFESVAVAL